MSTPFDPPRPLPLTDADREVWAAAWREYERASARAADQYEALPITHRYYGRIAKCQKCRCDVPEHGLCRMCRRRP